MNNKLISELTKAKQFFISKQFDKALNILNSAKNNYPYTKIINDSIIQFFIALNKSGEVIDFIVELQGHSNYHNEYDNILGDTYYQANQASLALAVFKRLLLSEPDNSVLMYKCALMLKDSGELSQARNLFEKALRYNFSNEEDCYAELADIYKEQKQESISLDFLKKIVQINPNNLKAKHDIASLHLYSGEINDAVRIYQEVINQDPKMVLSLLMLTYATEIDNSKHYLLSKLKQRLVSNETSHSDKENICFALGKAHDDIKDYKQALYYYRKANDSIRTRIPVFDKNHYLNKILSIKQFVEQNSSTTTIALSDTKFIFIVGHFRSGSTLVEQLLSSHSNIDTVGELDFFQRHLWNNNLDNQLNSDDCIKDLRRDYQQIIKEMHLTKEIIINKRLENLMFVGLIKVLFPSAKFIHTKRNFADNALSIYFQNLSNSLTFASDFKSIVEYDELSNELMTHWNSLFCDSIHTIYYEDVIDNIEIETRKLLDFIGVDFEENCLKFNENKNFVKTGSTIQVKNKLYSSSKSRIYNYLDYLTQEEKYILKV